MGYKFSADLSEIIFDKAEERNEGSKSYTEFLQSLPEAECRYALYDLDFELEGGEGKRSKICFISWAPDTAKIKHKMVFAASKDALKRKLVGISTEIQATDLSEVDYDVVLEKVTR